MLTQPKSGWSCLKIKDFEFPVSYTFDTPQDCIDSFTLSINKHVPFCVSIDGENLDECYIVSNNCHTLVTFIDQKTQEYMTKELKIGKKELLKEFIDDMKTQDWSHWPWNHQNTVYDISELETFMNNGKGDK